MPFIQLEVAAAASAIRQLGGRQLALERVESQSSEGQRTALEHFNYRDVASRTMEIIGDAWERKQSKLKGWGSR